MLTDVDGGRVCSGPIYEDPTITTGGKTKPPEPDYEVDPNLRNGTNWAQAYDVVTMALPASHGKEPSHLSIEVWWVGRCGGLGGVVEVEGGTYCG